MNFDKILHFVVGFVLTLITSILLNGFFALLVCGIAAGLKEYYDAKNPSKHTSDYEDFISTINGGVYAYALFLSVTLNI